MSSPVKSRNTLVFSSVGDNANLALWLSGREFDVWVCYYGDNDAVELEQQVEYFERKKGAKFPNFLDIFNRFGELIKHYEYVMVADDDLIISGEALSRVFDIMREQDLWLAQPAFDLSGKVSHNLTKVKPLSALRYVNFVEVTCPVFKTQKLVEFMAEYDPKVIGWGVDWWFSHNIDTANDSSNRIAVIDTVTCRNPLDYTKKNGREIERFQSKSDREKNWDEVKTSANIATDQSLRQYGIVPSYSVRQFLRYCRMRSRWLGVRIRDSIFR